MNRYRKHGHYHETSAIHLLRNVTQFLSRSVGTMPLILSGLSGVPQSTWTVDGKTSLHETATGYEKPAVITALLKAGADLKARHKDGKTPWDYAKINNTGKGTDAN